MTNLAYVEVQVAELGGLMEAIATRTISLQSSDASERFRRANRRLTALSRLLGPRPSFLDAIEDGWQFWAFISEAHKTYAARRDFVAREFTAHYRRLIDAAPTDFREALLQRDIEIVGELGTGGFGVVYEARHVTLDAPRAVKVFEPSFYEGDPESLRRFAREAEILTRLAHRSIVRLYDAGVAGRSPFIVTELVRGETLADRVDNCGPMKPEEARGVLVELLQAIAAAHAESIVHRDIKPQNVMKAADRVVLIDFGAGNALATGLSTSRLTQTTIGTPGYIAPELFADPRLRDPRIDIYSVGVTAHFLLTSRLPNPGDGRYYLRGVGVPEPLVEAIMRAMGPLETRFCTADAMRGALELT